LSKPAHLANARPSIDTESCSCRSVWGAKWRASPTQSVGFAVKRPTRSRVGSDFGPIIMRAMPTLSVHASSRESDQSTPPRHCADDRYPPGIGRTERSFLDWQLGMSGYSKISEETGKCLSLRSNAPLVSSRTRNDLRESCRSIATMSCRQCLNPSRSFSQSMSD